MILSCSLCSIRVKLGQLAPRGILRFTAVAALAIGPTCLDLKFTICIINYLVSRTVQYASPVSSYPQTYPAARHSTQRSVHAKSTAGTGRARLGVRCGRCVPYVGKPYIARLCRSSYLRDYGRMDVRLQALRFWRGPVHQVGASE